MTKIMLMNIPSGPAPTDYPPVGLSRVMEGIDPGLHCTVSILNLDYSRYSFDEIQKKIETFDPQIIGISGILTPAYVYVKKLSLFLKERFPRSVQVLGGEMAVMANILLHKTGIDFCIVGESEPTFSNFIRRLTEKNYSIADKSLWNDIKGLVYLSAGKAFFTGYEDESKCAILQTNYELLSRYGDISYYIEDVTGQYYTGRINKNEIGNFYALIAPGNLKKKMFTLFTSKGCTGACTYCHRYFKEYRTLDPDEVIAYMEHYLKTYNIGLMQFAEENFGFDHALTLKVARFLKARNINWAAAAVRAGTITEEYIKEWKASGCVNINFGIESCSRKILKVMGKGITVEQNLNALNLCQKYGIFTIVALVIGLPGETEETVQETIDALASVLPEDFSMPYELCIQWFQAVPGTPAYEYARKIGRIGFTLDEEERYIESLYEVNANNIKHYLNFTDYEKEEIAYWKDYIFMELVVAYMKKHGVIRVLRNKKANRFRYGALYILFPRFLRKNILRLLVMVNTYGLFAPLFLLYKKLFNKRPVFFSNVDRSLFKINKENPVPVRDDDASTHVLRGG